MATAKIFTMELDRTLAESEDLFPTSTNCLDNQKSQPIETEQQSVSPQSTPSHIDADSASVSDPLKTGRRGRKWIRIVLYLIGGMIGVVILLLGALFILKPNDLDKSGQWMDVVYEGGQSLRRDQAMTSKEIMTASIDQSLDVIKLASYLSDEEKINRVVNNTLVAAERAGLNPEQRMIELQKAVLAASQAIGLPVEDAQAYARKVVAQEQARLVGMNEQEQRITGAKAEAIARADQEQLSAVDTALKVAEFVATELKRSPTSGTDASVAAVAAREAESTAEQSGIAPAEKKVIAAQAYATIEAQTRRATPAEKMAYILASVSKAAQDAGASPLEEVQLTKRAMSTVSKKLGVSQEDQVVEAARIGAMARARSKNLSDLEQLALGEQAATIARGRAVGLTESEAQVMGDRAVENVIKAVGLPEDKNEALIKRVLAVSDVRDTGNRGDKIATAIEHAKAEADRLELSTVDREAYIAKAITEARAETASLNRIETKAAVAFTQAVARAKALGLGRIQQDAIGERAARLSMDLSGIPLNEHQVMLEKIIALEKQLSTDIPEFSSSRSIESAESMDTSNTEFPSNLRENVSSIEKRLASLSARLAEVTKLTEDIGSTYDKQQIETDLALNELHQAIATVKSSQEAIFGSDMKAVIKKLSNINEENSKLSANFGWLSNRVCEVEASVGKFNHPKACKSIYKKYQLDHSTTRTVEVEQKPLDKPREDTNSLDPNWPRTLKVEPMEQKESARIYATLPQTANLPESTTNIPPDACEMASKQYRYLLISESNALLSNRDDQTQNVVKGSWVEELGEALHFQAKYEPKFIMFTNGIVCR